MSNNEEFEYYLAIGDEIDPDRIKLYPPVINKFVQGTDTIEWITSDGKYLDDEGRECTLYIEFPEQYCFGVSQQFPMGTAEEDQTIDKLKGLQICYQIDSQNEEENDYVRSVCDALFNATVETLEIECKKRDDEEETELPEPTYNSWVAADRRGNASRAVKPIYSHPMVTQGKKKVQDTSKPERMYTKLMTTGKGRKLRVITPIYGPGDKPLNAMKLVDKRGKIHPVMKWEGAFWGAHGKTPYGGSVKFRISEANYGPARPRGLPSRRMLSKNTAPPMEDDNSDDEFSDPRGDRTQDAGAEDGTFKDVDGDDASDPAAELMTKNSKKDTKKEKKSKNKNSDSEEDKNDHKSKSRTKTSDKDKTKTAKAQAKKRALEKKRAHTKEKKKVIPQDSESDSDSE